MTKKKQLFVYMFGSFAVLLVLFGVVYGVFGFRVSSMMEQFSKPQPPTTVASATAETRQWVPKLSAVGTLKAVNGVDVTAELGGKVVKISFEAGDRVKKGDLLVQLDDSTDVADLAGLRAQVKLDQQSLQRTRTLYSKKLASKEQLDTAETQLERSRANLASKQAVVAQKAIKAPFDGQLGIREVDIGQYVSPGTPIVTLQALDHLYLNFSLPEQSLSRVARGQDVDIHVDTWPDSVFRGTIVAVSPKVDASTHNVAVQAEIDNPDHKLKPGMFADVSVYAGEPREVVTIPNTAVNYTLYGDSVFVIESADDKDGAKLKAIQHFVKLGEQRDDLVVVTDGLQAGTRVVSAGGFKLHDGAPVQINNDARQQKQNDSAEAAQ